MNPGAAAAFFAYGAFGLLAQVFLLRELAVVFLGHELSFNLALASWLLWTGAGAFPARGAAAPPGPAGPGEPFRAARGAAARALAWLAALAPLTLLAIRASKLLAPSGSLPGVAEAFFVPLILLAPVCLANGASFRLGSAVFPPGKLYFLECSGALAGGLLSSALIARGVPGLLAVSWGAAILAAAAWALGRGALPVIAAALAAMLLLARAPLERESRRLQFRGASLLESREGRTEHLAVASVGSLRVVYENGVVSMHFPDAAAAEELSQWPLLAHPKPSRVLLLGLGCAPALAAVLQRPVAAVDAVVPDLRALEAIRAHLDAKSAAAWSDPRVRAAEGDARDWVRAHDRAYDAIIQFTPDPANAALNRLFTAEFFAAARRALAPGGLLAFSIPSAENYLPPELAYANASVWNAARASFAAVEAIPGGRLVVLASDRAIDLDPARLARAYAARRLANTAVVPSQLPFYLMPERRAALAARLGGLRDVPPNADLKPVAYFLTWRVWLAKSVSPAHFLGLCVLAWAGCWGLLRLWARRRELLAPPANLALLCLGFTCMGVEIVLLLAFQAASGALYWRLGLLSAAFMAGLAAGSYLGQRGRGLRGALLLPLVSAAALGAGLAMCLPALAALSAARALAVFAGLLALDGLLLGSAYPLAAEGGPAAPTGGSAAPTGGPAAPTGGPALAYAADIWGGCLGAFATAAFLVPLLGMRASLLACAAAVVFAAVRLATGSFRSS